MKLNVPLTRPLTGPEEERAVADVLASGWLTQGPKVVEFEKAFASYISVPHAVANSNCTTSLHLALLLHGIGPGAEVVVPSYTWIATANVVRMVGAVPVFADIDLATFNVTADSIRQKLTQRTRAIMPVHQFGMPADLEPIEKLAQEHSIPIIEDAACATGSRYKGQPIGSRVNVACFSFHPRKLITMGEGGVLTTSDDDFARRARILINHGASVSDAVKHRAGSVEALLSEEFEEVGYNYRLTNLQGAVGVEQMKRLPGILAARHERASIYMELLDGLEGLTLPFVPGYASPNWQSYAVRVAGGAKRRNLVAQTLLDAGIACRPAYMACHRQSVYAGSVAPGSLPNTDAAIDSVLILPLYAQMVREEQEYVAETLREAMTKSQRS